LRTWRTGFGLQRLIFEVVAVTTDETIGVVLAFEAVVHARPARALTVEVPAHTLVAVQLAAAGLAVCNATRAPAALEEISVHTVAAAGCTRAGETVRKRYIAKCAGPGVRFVRVVAAGYAVDDLAAGFALLAVCNPLPARQALALLRIQTIGASTGVFHGHRQKTFTLIA
jgi:hypothetical protein